MARIFSQNLFDRFSSRGRDDLFPLKGVLKQEYRDRIDSAVFHGATVGLEEDRQHAKRLKLTLGEVTLPFMTWTAGQREFTPLLLGLYHLLPRTRMRKREDIKWVIIEEPELGLHPEALTAVHLLVLDLLWRGYRVALSTHSPHVLTAVWMLQRFKTYAATPELVCEAFGVAPVKRMRDVAEAALGKTYRVHLLSFDDQGRVRSKDISNLDPQSDDDSEAGWGGLTGFSSQFGEAVRKAANESGGSA